MRLFDIDINVIRQMLDQSPVGFVVVVVALTIQIGCLHAFLDAVAYSLVDGVRFVRQRISRGRSGS